MSMAKCPECGHQASTAASACPSCGVRTVVGRRQRLGLVHVASGVLVILFVIGFATIDIVEGGHAAMAVLLLLGFGEAICGLRAALR